MAETDSWKQRNPSVLFVNPSTGTERYERKDRLRGYLSLGTLASALRDKTFLQRFVDFLAATKFANGFHTIKYLSIPNRIKPLYYFPGFWHMCMDKS